jgi:BirA family biotin operon repressor/biotin-[acetyl-CoA-carboxylase] ligase
MNRLSAEFIRDAIDGSAGKYLDTLEVFDEIDSTNGYLLAADPPGIGRFRVALAEFQTAGRGRMQRRWISPRDSGVCLSIAYTFTRGQRNLPSLALAIGCGIAESLKAMGVADARVKWPNDVLVGGSKICGILSEVAPPSPAGLTIVVGVGLNVDLRDTPDELPRAAGAVTDLAACCDEVPARSAIAAILVSNLASTLGAFAEEGFASFAATWNRLDWLRGQSIKVDTATGVVAGVADGVDTDGALLLQTDSGRQRVTSGSVRLQQRAAG